MFTLSSHPAWLQDRGVAEQAANRLVNTQPAGLAHGIPFDAGSVRRRQV